MATAALLSSPHFLYRVELGVPVAGDANRRVLSDDELATRLSYGLWDTTPDAALQDAAARGDLLKRPEVLRGDGRAPAGLPARPRRRCSASSPSGWAPAAWTRTAWSRTPRRIPAATKTLARAMYQEVEALVASLVFEGPGADLLSLYDTRRTFVTAELAQLYGLPAGGGARGRPAVRR